MKIIFTKQDIERFGFTYEPDKSFCHAIPLWGKFHNLDDKNYIASRIISKYINSVYEKNGTVYVLGYGTIDFI